MKKPKIKKLESGLSVMTIPTDSPSVTVMSLVNTGSRFEDKEVNGISHFLEHMCFKGTEKKSGKDIMRYLDGLGAETNAFTSYELTGYYVKSITKHWKKTLGIVSDIYLHSVFPEEEMEKEKGVIIGEISMYEDIPMRHVYDIFSELVYGDQPAGWNILGPREVIKKMKRDNFLEYHRDHYVAEATTIVAAGNVDHKDVVEEVEKKFKNISKQAKKPQTKAILDQQVPRLKVLQRATDQTHLILGYTTEGFHHKDTIPLKVLGSILGGGMSSRLFEKIREDMGVGYYVHAKQSTQSDTGIMQISCGIDSSRVAEVVKAILEETSRLTKELVSVEELTKIQEYIIGNTNMNLESSDDRAYYYGQHYLFGLPLRTPQEFAREIKSVTSKDLRRVAKKYFSSKRLNVAMIGPHNKKEQKQLLKLLM